MKKELFESWLNKQGVKSYQSYSSRIKSVENKHGDLDEHYDKDRCKSLLQLFSYTKEDMAHRRTPKHDLLSTPTGGKDKYESYFEGTNDFRSRISRYIDFRDDMKKSSNNAPNKDASDVSLCWYVGVFTGDVDQTEKYVNEGIWQNGYKDKYLEIVNSIQVNDKIAIKSSHTQKHNLPFDNNDLMVSAMTIKAIGTVTKNHGDGRTLDVDWIKLDEPKRWYFFTNWKTIWKVEAHPDDWMYKSLLDFTFKDIPQDIQRFLRHPYWAEKYGIPDEDEEISVEEISESYDTYSREDFLKDVFMSEEKYNTIVELLQRKKNVILQGAPGVGKTFAAKKLAYAIMGEKAIDRIKCIQFHQSYSYEEFVMGYRPDGEGFALKNGVFYNFCEEARSSPNESFFFIIDEINRGNLSKIFGEILMLIENDKRGEKLYLAYSDDMFSVPPNLYIIGMMNTADRSLAIIDYALRRRFCFVELEPAFEFPAFKTFLLDNDLDEALADKIISKFSALNHKIASDPSLGSGFRIGHSYFCDCKNISTQWYDNIVKYEIEPVLKEYWFDDSDTASDYSNELLR